MGVDGKHIGSVVHKSPGGVEFASPVQVGAADLDLGQGVDIL